jgi:hypothetical protein
MPALVKSEPPKSEAPKRTNALGEAVRAILEQEYAGLMESVRDDLLEKLQAFMVGKLGSTEILEAARLIKGQPTLDSVVAKLEKAFGAAIDERMSDVVQGLVELRRESKVQAQQKPPKPQHWVCEVERKDDKIVRMEFTPKAE